MASFKTSYRDAVNDLFESHLGTSPKLRLLTGDGPATVAATQTGTLIATLSLPSDWMGASSSGLKSKSGTWSGSSIATGVIGYARFMDSGDTTAYYQFSVSEAFALTTSGATSALSNVLNFTATTGVTIGMGVYGSGIQSGTTVLDVGVSTVTLSLPSLSGVAGTTPIYFGDTDGELWAYPANIGSISVTITVNQFDLLASGA